MRTRCQSSLLNIVKLGCVVVDHMTAGVFDALVLFFLVGLCMQIWGMKLRDQVEMCLGLICDE